VTKVQDSELDDCGSLEVFLICAKLISWCTSFRMKLSRPKFVLLILFSNFYCDSEGEDSMVVRSIGRYSPNNIVSHPGRL
jgi:hypothetical protein